MDWQGIRVFAFDLDGTALEGDRLGAPVREQLAAFRARGGIAVSASGRDLATQQMMFLRGGLAAHHDFPPYVIDCGHFLHRRDGDRYVPVSGWNDRVRTVWRAALPALHRRETRLREAFAAAGLAGSLIGDGRAHEAMGYYPWLFPAAGDAEKAMALLSELFGDLETVAPERNRLIAGLAPRDADKGAALGYLLGLLGLPRRAALAVGDSANDLPMLDGRHGFRAAAVGNAEECVKQAVRRAGGYVAAAAEAAGVGETLGRVLEAWPVRPTPAAV